MSSLIRVAEAPTAGGAESSEILIAAAMAFAVMAAAGYVVVRERTGHATLVGRLADKVSGLDGLPRWAGLPSYLGLLSVISCGFGVWWDVPIHMQNGRDEGPLANPSHYFIFLGILGFLHSGILGLALAKDPLPRRTLRLTRSWRSPIGPLVMVGAGMIALIGFPADDAWHRLFGQDVTEWGPTHVMMIGGAVTSLFAVPLVLAEAQQVGARGAQGLAGRVRMALAIGVCAIPFAFLMEFDLGVPQFPAVTQFIIAGFLTGWVYVAARMWFGPGGALVAFGFYAFARFFLYFSVAALEGVLTARFLLFLPAVLIAEAVALVLSPKHRPATYALVAGLLIGTVGLFVEWVWSLVFMPLPQPFPADKLPLMLGAGAVAAVGGSLLALWFVSRLELTAAAQAHPEVAGPPLPRRGYGLAGMAVFVVLMGVFAPQQGPGDRQLSATIDYTDVRSASGAEACDGSEECTARLLVTVNDPGTIQDAVWFYTLAWQGRGTGGDQGAEAEPGSDNGGVLRYALEPTGERGVYLSEEPLPIHGNWKVMLRLHLQPSTMIAFPVYFPDDPAIESERGRLIIAEPGETVAAAYEPGFLQRERKDDVPAWTWGFMYALVILTWLLLLLGYGWCYDAAAAGASTGRSQGKRARTPQRT